MDTISETRGTGSAQLFDYAYDGVDRLVEALNPTAYGLPASEAYEYDAAGNRETPGSPSDYVYDANNRITASPGATYTFDDDGNLQTKNAGLSSEERFTFDKTNRLVYWEKGPAGSPTATASYAYDPFGRRTKKAANGTTTWFVWDGDVLTAEFDGSGTRTRRYTYDGGWAPAELVVKAGSSEMPYAVTTDHLDTPRMLTSSSGVAVWRSSHESFGTAVVDEDPDGDTNLVSFNVRSPGQYADAETGLHDNYWRTYDPTTGRYLSADPIGQPGGINLHVYARSNPFGVVDPFGLKPGDKYKDLNSAASDAIGDINPRSIAEDTEYGGWIYKNPDGSYSYTEPAPGSPDGLDMPPLPPGKKREECSSYHTHGAYDPKYDYSTKNPNWVDGNEEVSPTDTYYDAKAGTPGFLGTPKGKKKRYDPPAPGRPSGEGNTSAIP